MLWLRYENADGTVVVRSFEQPATIGRSVQCEVQFSTRLVSSVHARLAFSRDTWTVQDLNSRNGTYLNGVQVEHGALLSKGEIQLGVTGPVLEFSVGEPFPDHQQAPEPPPAQPQRAPVPLASTVFAEEPLPPTPTPVAPAEALPQHYQAQRFTLALPEAWQDRTVYSILGPLNDDFQHNITINVNPDAPFDSVDAYAREQVSALEGALQGCRVLKDEPVFLTNGMPAHRAIVAWYPTDDLKIYQEQVYVLHDTTGYCLTASFTPKTRKTLGPEIERVMLGFNPVSR